MRRGISPGCNGFWVCLCIAASYFFAHLRFAPAWRVHLAKTGLTFDLETAADTPYGSISVFMDGDFGPKNNICDTSLQINGRWRIRLWLVLVPDPVVETHDLLDFFQRLALLCTSGSWSSMVGSDESVQKLGLIPCAISWLYSSIERRREKTWTDMTVSVSAIELCCGEEDTLRDLLGEFSPLVGSAQDSPQPRIRLQEDPVYGIQVGKRVISLLILPRLPFIWWKETGKSWSYNWPLCVV